METVRQQIDRFEKFCRKLLVRLGANSADVERALSTVRNSDFPPRLTLNETFSVVSAGPYSVDFAKISSPLENFYSNECGEIGRQFTTARESVRQAMFEVQEILSKYAEVMTETTPEGFLNAFDQHLSDSYPFWRPAWGDPMEACSQVGYLNAGVSDVSNLSQRLLACEKLEWATAMFDSVADNADEIERFIAEVTGAFTLHWIVEEERVVVGFVPPATTARSFKTLHTLNRTHRTKYGTWVEERITATDVIEEARREIRRLIESALPPEE
jgi:hypothetical protein